MVIRTQDGHFIPEIDVRQTSWRHEYPFESHFHEVRSGMAMHYIDVGPKDGPVLVMFHGNPTWSFFFRNIIKHFQHRYRCIAMDHIGCGLSSRPTLKNYRFQLEERIEDAARLLDHLGIEKATFILHDWGGAIGMGVAAINPQRIQRIILFNTAAFRFDFIPRSINLCKVPILGEFMILGFNGFARVAQWRAVSQDLLPPSTRSGYLAPYNTPRNRLATLKFVHDIPMDPSHPSYQTLVSVEMGLQNFRKTPILIVWGDDDFCFNPAFRAEWQRRFPHAECYAYPDGGHYIVEDKLDEVLWHMDAFLNSSSTTLIDANPTTSNDTNPHYNTSNDTEGHGDRL